MQIERPIIKMEGIGVQFELGGARKSVRHVLRDMFRRKPKFWAIRDINFEIFHEEIFYIIGRNGAGKSTLLNVMAETLFPDFGKMYLYGETSAFLSMGLGFRPDLSGYENINISLRLMGVPKKDLPIYRKEITDFTQLQDFLDSPVRTYSTGMKARLAFAVATSFRPEILILDEGINTGDEVFREKCKIRFEEMLKSAKAVIVCTHNLNTAAEMATRVLWLESGRIMKIGDPKEVIQAYRDFIKEVRKDPFFDRKAFQERLVNAKEYEDKT